MPAGQPSPAGPEDRAPRSLGGCSASNITAVPHRNSSSSAVHTEFEDVAHNIKDMAEKMDKMEAKMDKMDKIESKMDKIMTQEDYEKAKKDLMVERQNNSDLRRQMQELQNDAKQMERRVEEERERQSSDCNKKDMDLSDMKQKCSDLQLDLERRERDVSQLNEKVEELEKEKENLNHLQSTHNTKVSDYIEKMVNQHNLKVQQITELETESKDKDQKIQDLTSQLKDEKQKKDQETTKRRILDQQLKEARAQSAATEEQMSDLKRMNEDLSKARDQASKTARAEQSKLKVLDEQKRELERERAFAAENIRQLESDKLQLESDKMSLQERVKKNIKESEQMKEEHSNAVSQALRHRHEEIVDLQNQLIEAKAKVEAFSMDIQQASLEKQRAEQILAEERQEFQIKKVQVDDLKKQLERVDKDRSRKMSVEHDKENQKLHEAVKCQKATIWDLESQLRQERGACALLSPAEAARILKVREDALIQDNNSLNIELGLVKDELQRIKGGPKNQAPHLEIQQQLPFTEPNSLVSTPSQR